MTAALEMFIKETNKENKNKNCGRQIGCLRVVALLAEFHSPEVNCRPFIVYNGYTYILKVGAIK